VSSSQTAPRVRAMMSRDVVTIHPTARAATAAGELRRRHLAGLPVVNDHMQVVGTVGAADLSGRGSRTVAEVMTRPARTIDEESTVAEAAELLLHQRLLSLPVVCNGKLAGRLSRAGLVTYLCRHQWVCGRCGTAERGTGPPAVCLGCDGPGGGFQLEEAVPGL